MPVTSGEEISMPLNENQRTELRAMIDARRDALLAEMREDAGRMRDHPYAEHAGPVTDAGDASVATLIADLEQADSTRDLDEFRMLDAARERLRDGSYGICTDCGSEIGFERLRAFPPAPRCIGCQERHEKTYRGEPGRGL
jgi:DnaK suppressor protein